MHVKLIVIFNTYRGEGGTTSCVLCGRYEIKLFKKGVGPKLTASDQQVIDLTNPNIMHCFMDTFSDP